MSRRPPFSEEQLRAAVQASLCWSDVIRELGRVPRGGNHKTVRKYARLWGVSTDHFDPTVRIHRGARRRLTPLEDVLVEHSPYPRGMLKKRLYREGVKDRVCELCGQSEEWQGRRMALILDHVNGVNDDNRIENLRIVCPNCAATLPTHCARNPVLHEPRECVACGDEFLPRYHQHRYCSLSCAGTSDRGVPRPERRKVERPPYEQLLAELEATNYSAVGRKYGVSDNAVRKWVRFYERSAGRGA